jgi:NTE family protein
MRPWWRREPKAKTITLALQGGGAHGAYTWGVLDRLLEEPRIVIEGVSATSAGAMNAVVLAQGLMTGGAQGGRTALESFWYGVSGAAQSAPFQSTWLSRWLGSWNMGCFPATLALDVVPPMLSPYKMNPFNLNPLRDLLVKMIDFDRLKDCSPVKLFISATNVRSGRIRVFETRELSADVLMASASLPLLFRAVEIDGQAYWDGGYMGNPAIFPLIYDCESRDVLIVRVTPIRRQEVPKTAREILNRINEISFNSSLMREMRAIAFVTRLIDERVVKRRKLKRILVHDIDAEPYMAQLSSSSKIDPHWHFLMHLRDVGRESANRWLQTNFDKLGVESSIDLRAEFL